jgi:hypothetical protein
MHRTAEVREMSSIGGWAGYFLLAAAYAFVMYLTTRAEHRFQADPKRWAGGDVMVVRRVAAEAAEPAAAQAEYRQASAFSPEGAAR